MGERIFPDPPQVELGVPRLDLRISPATVHLLSIRFADAAQRFAKAAEDFKLAVEQIKEPQDG